jgi:hypothetical protein
MVPARPPNADVVAADVSHKHSVDDACLSAPLRADALAGGRTDCDYSTLPLRARQRREERGQVVERREPRSLDVEGMDLVLGEQWWG